MVSIRTSGGLIGRITVKSRRYTHPDLRYFGFSAFVAAESGVPADVNIEPQNEFGNPLIDYFGECYAFEFLGTGGMTVAGSWAGGLSTFTFIFDTPQLGADIRLTDGGFLTDTQMSGAEIFHLIYLNHQDEVRYVIKYDKSRDPRSYAIVSRGLLRAI